MLAPYRGEEGKWGTWAVPSMYSAMSWLLRAYLGIVRVRLGDRLTYEIDLPPEIAGAPILPMMPRAVLEIPYEPIDTLTATPA